MTNPEYQARIDAAWEKCRRSETTRAIAFSWLSGALPHLLDGLPKADAERILWAFERSVEYAMDSMVPYGVTKKCETVAVTPKAKPRSSCKDCRWLFGAVVRACDAHRKVEPEQCDACQGPVQP